MSAQTFSDLRHEAFFRQMADEGIVIEYTPTTKTHTAYRRLDTEGPCGFGVSAEDAYLHLLELEGE
jgi:hypothetical protein